MCRLILVLAAFLTSTGCLQADQVTDQLHERQAEKTKAVKSIPDGAKYQFEWSWIDQDGKPVREDLWSELVTAYRDTIPDLRHLYEPHPPLEMFPEFLRTQTNGELGFENIRGQLFLIPKEENRKSNLDVLVDLDLDNGTFWEGLSDIALQINRKGRIYGAYFSVGFSPAELFDFEAFTKRCITLHVKSIHARDAICEMLNQSDLKIALVYKNKIDSGNPLGLSYLQLISQFKAYDMQQVEKCILENSKLNRRIMEICGLDDFGRPLKSATPEGESDPKSGGTSASPPPSSKSSPSAPEADPSAQSTPGGTPE